MRAPRNLKNKIKWFFISIGHIMDDVGQFLVDYPFVVVIYVWSYIDLTSYGIEPLGTILETFLVFLVETINNFIGK